MTTLRNALRTLSWTAVFSIGLMVICDDAGSRPDWCPVNTICVEEIPLQPVTP